MESLGIFVLLAGLFSYLNYKWIKLPNTIALMIIGLIFSILIIASKNVVPDLYRFFCGAILDADFEHLLLNGILSFLLFAGAIHVDITALAKQRKDILAF